MRYLLWGLAIVFVLLVVVRPLLDRVVFPEPQPGLEFVPKVGQVFHSESEGFTQRIIRREPRLIWSELTLHPHAPGPPPHVHTTFAERFRVQRGTVLSLSMVKSFTSMPARSSSSRRESSISRSTRPKRKPLFWALSPRSTRCPNGSASFFHKPTASSMPHRRTG